MNARLQMATKKSPTRRLCTGCLYCKDDFRTAPGNTFSSVIIPVVVLAADVELAGVLLFIFRASSSGLEAAGAVLTLLPGLGSRLMTGMAELETVGRGAARRLLRVVVVVELVEEAGWVEVVAGGETDFSGSGAKRGYINRKIRRLFQGSINSEWQPVTLPFTHTDLNSEEVKEAFNGLFLWLLLLTRRLEDLLDLADGSLFLLI